VVQTDDSLVKGQKHRQHLPSDMRHKAVGMNVNACGAGRRQPSPEAAHETLCAALQEQASWEQRAHVAKELLHEMLKSRREAADLQQQYDIKFVPRSSLALILQASLLAWQPYALCLASGLPYCLTANHIRRSCSQGQVGIHRT
jgi:hypothetical protein